MALPPPNQATPLPQTTRPSDPTLEQLHSLAWAWFVTFGFGQPLAGCFTWIPEAVTYEQARERVVLVYGRRWAFIYGREEYDKAVVRFGVREVEFGTPNE